MARKSADVDNYEDLLDRQWDDIPEKQLLPLGRFILELRGTKLRAPSKEGVSPQVVFAYTPRRPVASEDGGPDEDDLAALGPDYNLAENTIFFNMWYDPTNNNDARALRRHVEKHGVDTTGMTMKETLEAAKGQEISAYIDHRSYVNGAGEEVVEEDAKAFIAVE